MARKIYLQTAVAFMMALPILFSSGCSKEKTEEPIVAVQVAPVEKETIQRTVTAEAILFPLQQSAIVPKISAPVQKFYVKRGSPVHQGQLLAMLENRDLAAAQTDTRGAYEQAQAAYETTTAATLPEDIEKAKGDAQTTKSATGQLQSAKGKYLGAEAQLSYSEVRSPIDGFVTDRPLYPGEMAAAGTPLITVMDLSQVIARAHISQQEAALLKAGDKAQ